MLTDDDLIQILMCWEAASPAPVATIMLSTEADPVEWFRECLSQNIPTEVYGVARGTPEEIEGHMALVTALTGNGPTSKANADFYALCHTAIPALVDEIRRERSQRAWYGRMRHG